MRFPAFDWAATKRSLGGNRHFAAFVAAIAIPLLFFPGSPAAIFLIGESTPTPVLTTNAPAPRPSTPDIVGPPVRTQTRAADPSSSSPTSIPEPIAEIFDDLVLPPAGPPVPDVPCDTDAVVETADTIRASLAGIAGSPIPGESIEDLAELAAGCSDSSEAEVVLNLALEIATYVPDLGLPIIDLPDLPALPDLPIPAEAIAALGPVAEQIRTGCQQLGTVTLVLVIAPPAFHLPFTQSDLIQFLAPANAVCGYFDGAA